MSGTIGQGGPTDPRLGALEQRRGTFETSVRQARAKASPDATGLAAIERKYETLLGTVSAWQAAAFGDAASRVKADAMAKDAARAMATFARDVRTYAGGVEAPVQSRSIDMFETEMKAGARYAEGLDEAQRTAAGQKIAWQPWASVR